MISRKVMVAGGGSLTYRFGVSGDVATVYDSLWEANQALAWLRQDADLVARFDDLRIREARDYVTGHKRGHVIRGWHRGKRRWLYDAT